MGNCCSKMSPGTQHADSHRWPPAALPPNTAVATSTPPQPPRDPTSSGSSFMPRDTNPLESVSLSPSRGLVSAANVGSSLEGIRGARSTLSDGVLDACLDARSSFSSTTFPSEAGYPLHCGRSSVSAQRVTALSPAAVDVICPVGGVTSLPRFASYAATDSSVPSRAPCSSQGLVEVSAMLVPSRESVVLPSTLSSFEVSAALNVVVQQSGEVGSNFLHSATIH